MEAVTLLREKNQPPVRAEKADDLQPGFVLRLLDEIDYGLVLVNAQGRVQHATTWRGMSWPPAGCCTWILGAASAAAAPA